MTDDKDNNTEFNMWGFSIYDNNNGNDNGRIAITQKIATLTARKMSAYLLGFITCHLILFQSYINMPEVFSHLKVEYIYHLHNRSNQQLCWSSSALA